MCFGSTLPASFGVDGTIVRAQSANATFQRVRQSAGTSSATAGQRNNGREKATSEETVGAGAIAQELGITDDSTAAAKTLPARPTFVVPDTNMPTGWIPQRTSHMVNDYTGILTEEQRDALEQRLLSCEDSSGVQILLLIVPDLGGDEISSFAQHVWESWGVGNKQFNNGVMLVVKPKNSTGGQVRIQTGYGMEGAMPDAFCKRIIEDNMIPNFKENDYYAAIDEALNVIIPVCNGEYSYKQYKKDQNKETYIGLIAFVIFIGLILLFTNRGNKKGNGDNGSRHFYGGTPFVGGGGSWGGGGSSFGGWGGGSSGGGGASGSW